MSVGYSARNKTNDPLPYDKEHSLPQASDAYNAHVRMGSEWDKLREGDRTIPRFPANVERSQVTGTDAVVIINDIFNRHILKDSDRLDEDDGTLSLNMNRDPKSQEEISETMDLLRILNSTVNGKSTVNWIRDFNNLNNTHHSIDSVDINMGYPHAYEKTRDLDTPNLNFHISPNLKTHSEGAHVVNKADSLQNSLQRLDLESHFMGQDLISNPGSPHESFADSNVGSPGNDRAEDSISPNPNAADAIVQQPIDSPNPDTTSRQPSDVVSPDATDSQGREQQADIDQQNALRRSITSALNFCVQCLHLLGGSRVEDNSSS